MIEGLTAIEGRFYRAIPMDRLDHVLDPPGPESAGRYHRPGQPTIYITREADWAVIAISRYLVADGIARVIVPLKLTTAYALDQRDQELCARLGFDAARSGLRWQKELAEGREPPSWANADIARKTGADGIIDPSRGISGGWHVALFRWNGLGAPSLTIDGDPLPVHYEAARARWPSPPGWAAPSPGITSH